MSPWLFALVVMLVGLTIVAAVLFVPFLLDLSRHRKGKSTQSRESEDTG